jgi:hypothetical protein
VENGKKKWAKKKKRDFLLAGPGGVFDPAERERARGHGRRPSQPMKEQRRAGGRRGHGPTRQREEGGLTARSGRRRGG